MSSSTISASPSAFFSFVSSLLSPHCASLYLHQYHFLDSSCFSLLFAKSLGYAIILGSVAVKIPQILLFLKMKSADGVRPSMYILENIGYIILSAYNYRNGYPFSSYGESVFLFVQGMVLFSLVFYYNNNRNVMDAKYLGGISAFLLLALFLLSPALSSLSLLSSLQTLTIPIFSASKIPQIIENFSHRSTGNLAIITLALNFVGSMARCFTTLKETNDQLLFVGIVVGTVLNGILVAQWIGYRGKGKGMGKGKEGEVKRRGSITRSMKAEAGESAEGLVQRKTKGSKKAD